MKPNPSPWPRPSHRDSRGARTLPLIACVLAGDLVLPGFGAVLTAPVVSAIDRNGNATTPLITPLPGPGNPSSYKFATGSSASGPFISSLEFTFTLSALEPNLLINFSHLDTLPDPTTGISSFRDAFVVSLFYDPPRGSPDAPQTWTLFSFDSSFLVGDPFGTAPHTLVVGPVWPPTRPFDYNLNADLSPLAGKRLTLAFDIINLDDGWSSTFEVDSNIRLELFPIPEPQTGLVLIPVALFALCLRRRNSP